MIKINLYNVETKVHRIIWFVWRETTVHMIKINLYKFEIKVHFTLQYAKIWVILVSFYLNSEIFCQEKEQHSLSQRDTQIIYLKNIKYVQEL